jgi:hypothetical protein
MKISSKKLAELHQYFINEGSTEPEDVAAQLGTEDEAEVNAYVEALKAKYPEVYGGEVPEEPLQYFLIDNDTGLTKELELVKQKGAKRFFEVIEPKDIVEIVVGGERIEVDLIKLRKKAPGDKLGNHLVSTLILAAELAKG